MHTLAIKTYKYTNPEKRLERCCINDFHIIIEYNKNNIQYYNKLLELFDIENARYPVSERYAQVYIFSGGYAVV